MEAKVATIEAHIEHIREALKELKGDLRTILFLMGAGFIALAGIMARGFEWF